VRRFRREARVAAGLSHPNLVRVFDFGDDPRPYLVMEYVEGGTLTEHLREAGRELDCHGLVRGTGWTPLDDLDVAADVATHGPNVTVVSTGVRQCRLRGPPGGRARRTLCGPGHECARRTDPRRGSPVTFETSTARATRGRSSRISTKQATSWPGSSGS
jgi:hypothetical protein